MKRQLIGKALFADDNPRIGEGIVEVPVLLESWQLAALEAAASAHGLTAGNLVRCLLRDFLSSFETEWPASSDKSDAPKREDASQSLSFSPTGRGE